jgi:hypothetical protein
MNQHSEIHTGDGRLLFFSVIQYYFFYLVTDCAQSLSFTQLCRVHSVCFGVGKHTCFNKQGCWLSSPVHSVRADVWFGQERKPMRYS